jgi:glycosyltransferase involved in cell wall biosynthesis
MLVVVTPVKNESENLVNLSQIILRQTQRPNFWLIIDDGSTDDTPHIIANLEKNTDSLRVFHFKQKM